MENSLCFFGQISCAEIWEFGPEDKATEHSKGLACWRRQLRRLEGARRAGANYIAENRSAYRQDWATCPKWLADESRYRHFSQGKELYAKRPQGRALDRRHRR